jgi:hypothetical protein
MARAFSGAAFVSPLAALLVSTGPVRAQTDKRACLSTYVEVQSSRQEGQLIAARAAAVTCGNDACPPVLRNDCVTWLRELDAAIPTVVFSASTPDGHDLADARVSIDGRKLVEPTAGEAVALDPGAHVLSCEAYGYERVEVSVVAAQGIENRPVHFEMEPAGQASRGLVASRVRPIRPATYVLGAIGIMGLGVWGAVGASAFWGTPSVETLDRCKPNCSTSDRADVQRKLDVADIAGGAALLALGGALVLHITRPAAASLAVAPLRDGAFATYRTRF